MDREEVFKKRVSSCVTFEAFYRNTAGRSAPTRDVYPKPFGPPAAAFPAAQRCAFADAGFGAGARPQTASEGGEGRGGEGAEVGRRWRERGVRGQGG